MLAVYLLWALALALAGQWFFGWPVAKDPSRARARCGIRTAPPVIAFYIHIRPARDGGSRELAG
jgi:hypothetical protein